MRSVELRLSASHLSKNLAAMREWLDRRGFQPSVFRYKRDDDGIEVVIYVTFKIDTEAAELAEEFGGMVVTTGA